MTFCHKVNGDLPADDSMAFCHVQAMETVGSRIAAAREASGMTQAQLAAKLGVDQSTLAKWERDQRLPRGVAPMMRVANAVDRDYVWIMTGKDAPPEVDFSRAQPVPILPRDLPVYGSVKGGFDGELIDLSSPIDWTERPSSLYGLREAAALYVQGTSMEPRYFPGEILIAHPGRAISKGCFVIVEFQDHTGVVKRWVRGDDKVVEVEQFNPPKKRTYPRAEVLHVYRIIRGGEE